MSEPFDLDARRAQYDDKPKPVRLGGEVYDLPARLPMSVIMDLDRGRYEAALGSLFGEENVATVGPLLDLDLVIDMARELYGPGVGEASASSASSKKNGARSRPTSVGSTNSTSTRRASAKGNSVSSES